MAQDSEKTFKNLKRIKPLPLDGVKAVTCSNSHILNPESKQNDSSKQTLLINPTISHIHIQQLGSLHPNLKDLVDQGKTARTKALLGRVRRVVKHVIQSRVCVYNSGLLRCAIHSPAESETHQPVALLQAKHLSTKRKLQVQVGMNLFV